MNTAREKQTLQSVFGAALRGIAGGIKTKEERSPPKPWAADKDTGFTVMLYRHLRNGTVFLPIEKTGRSFYFYSTFLLAPLANSEGVRRNRRLAKDKRYALGNELFVKASPSVARSYHSDKDGIFGANTWCVVKKDNPRN